MHLRPLVLTALLLSFGIFACKKQSTEAPTQHAPAPTLTRTSTPDPFQTPTLTRTPTHTRTRTLTPTPSVTRTSTNTGTITSSPTPTRTGTCTLNTAPPSSTVRLIFLHHSCGCNWLATSNGNLGAQLNANNYYVSDAYYGWADPPSPPAQYTVMGDHTDTGDWPYWFNGNVMPYVYAETAAACYSPNTVTNPGGENEVILFKSCYPNSDVGASIDDEKALYNSLLPYFQAHPEKMFILCVPPPMVNIPTPSLTRQLANWLEDPVAGWLSGYSGSNVFVFDMYNILTDPNNHHRVNGGVIEHVVTSSPADPSNPDELYYPSGDDHPSTAGNQKVTAEFTPLLNAWYHQWKGL